MVTTRFFTIKFCCKTENSHIFIFLKVKRNLHIISNYGYTDEQILKTPIPNVIVLELGEYTTKLQVLFGVDILANNKLPANYLGHNIRGKAITEIKKTLDENNIEMPSQVPEHKMYSENTFNIKQ